MAGDLSKCHLLSILPDVFLHDVHWVVVFGTAGNEAIMVTQGDEVYAIGANANCCLGLSSAKQVGFLPMKVELLCGKDIAHISYGNGPHVLALTTSGMVYSWGHNGYGQLGHGTTSIYSGNPALVSSGFTHKVIRIACGGFHSIALMENGEIFSWGFNNCGQLGCGDTHSRYAPTKISGYLENKCCSAVTCSHTSTYALTTEGEVYSWGQNNSGQLGLGSLTQQLHPQLVPVQGMIISKIVAGHCHVLALSDGGHLYSWGGNGHGQLGLNTKQCATKPTSVLRDMERFLEIGASHLSNTSAATNTNGKVFMWGDCHHQKIPSPIETPFSTLDEVFTCFSSPSCTWRPFINAGRNRDSSVSKCIEKRFNDQDTADLTFIVEGNPIYAHKTILRIRCAYFYSMFHSNRWKEGQMDTLEISDQPYNTFYAFLKYLYTDKVSIKPEESLGLYQLADLYCEDDLKKHCERMMCEQINLDSVLSLYSIARQHNAKELEQRCLMFSMKHATAVVMSSSFVNSEAENARDFVVKLAEGGAFKS